jgi:hypothetical protein
MARRGGHRLLAKDTGTGEGEINIFYLVSDTKKDLKEMLKKHYASGIIYI